MERWVSRITIGAFAAGGIMMIIGAATKAPTTVTVGMCISAVGFIVQGISRLARL